MKYHLGKVRIPGEGLEKGDISKRSSGNPGGRR